MPYRASLAEKLTTQLEHLISNHGLHDAKSLFICDGAADGESDGAYYLIMTYAEREPDSIKLGYTYVDAQIALARAFES